MIIRYMRLNAVIILMIGLTIISSCSFGQAMENPRAVSLNNEALKLVTTKKSTKKDSFKIVFKLLDSAIKIDPNYKMAYSNKIYYLTQIERWKEALKYTEILQKLSPPSGELLSGKADILKKLKRNEQALVSYREALKILETEYKKNHWVVKLMNLSYVRFRIYDKIDSAYSLIDREKYRYKDSALAKKQLFAFKRKILPEIAVKR